MARKKKETTENEGLKIIPVSELLDTIDEANLEHITVVGRTKGGAISLFSTIPTAMNFHHQLNAGIFQLNVMEHSALQQMAEGKKAAEIE